MEVIDLSVMLSEDLPATWPTEPQLEITVSNWFEDALVDGIVQKSAGSFKSLRLVLSDHIGTHSDAPSHFIPPEDSGLANSGPLATKTVEQLELRQLMGPAAVIDCRSVLEDAEPNMSPMVGPEKLEQWEREHGSVQPGDVVLIWTGWDARYVAGAEGAHYYSSQGLGSDPGWPAIAPETLEYLLNHGVTTVGTDSPSVGALQDVAATHIYGLSRDMKYIECLCNLAALPPRGSWFVFLPLKLRGGTAAPGRAIAIVDLCGASR